jgi:hypothetical protein
MSFCAQNPSLSSCFSKIIPQTARLLSNAYIETTQHQNALLTRISTFFISVTTSFWLNCTVCVEMGWQFLLIHHLLKCPTLPFGRSCNWRDGQGILLYSYAPVIHKGVAKPQRNLQIPNIAEFSASRRSVMQRDFIQGHQTPYFNWT